MSVRPETCGIIRTARMAGPVVMAAVLAVAVASCDRGKFDDSEKVVQPSGLPIEDDYVKESLIKTDEEVREDLRFELRGVVVTPDGNVELLPVNEAAVEAEMANIEMARSEGYIISAEQSGLLGGPAGETDDGSPGTERINIRGGEGPGGGERRLNRDTQPGNVDPQGEGTDPGARDLEAVPDNEGEPADTEDAVEPAPDNGEPPAEAIDEGAAEDEVEPDDPNGGPVPDDGEGPFEAEHADAGGPEALPAGHGNSLAPSPRPVQDQDDDEVTTAAPPTNRRGDEEPSTGLETPRAGTEDMPEGDNEPGGFDGDVAPAESIIGSDTRAKVTATAQHPYRMVGRVDIGCSGTLIGPRHVLTAAHCVYNIRDDKWYSNLSFTPGQSDKTTSPHGKIGWTRAITVQGWTERHMRNYDYAIIVLNQDIGDTVGFMTYGWKNPMPEYNVNINGYPGDKPEGTMWHSFCGLKIVRPHRLYYACDTFGGMSGSHVYVYNQAQNSRTVYGIHAYGRDSTGFNGATRIRKSVFLNLKDWKSKY